MPLRERGGIRLELQFKKARVFLITILKLAGITFATKRPLFYGRRFWSMTALALSIHAPIPYKVAGARAIPQDDRFLLLGANTVHTLTPDAGRRPVPLLVPDFAPFEDDIVSMTASANAKFIVAIISSGCVLKWDARTGHLAALPTLPVLNSTASQSTEWNGASCGISNEGDTIMVVASNRRLFIRDESYLRWHTGVSRLDGNINCTPSSYWSILTDIHRHSAACAFVGGDSTSHPR